MTTLMRIRGHAARRIQRGLSIIEVMVGIVVGLLIALAITSSVATIGKQFRITGAGHAAAEGALLGLGLIDRDVRMAGAALFNGSFAALCPSFNMFKNGAATQNGTKMEDLFPIVEITDGGAGVPDILDVMVSQPDPSSGVSVPVTMDMPNPSVLKVSDPRGLLRVGDIVVVAPPPPNTAQDPCTRIQVTGITGACSDSGAGCQVQFSSTSVAGSSDEYNPKPGTYLKEPKYQPGSVLFRAPSFRFDFVRYRVKCGSLLRVPYTIDPDVAPPDAGADLQCVGAPTYRTHALSSDVVMLKAHYGIANAGSDQIAQWKTAAATTTEELRRVKAVRVAIVARSKEAGSTAVTPAAPTVFGGALTLDLTGVAVPAGKTWQNYRYRVHETVVPVRNAAWNR